jgi:hypothetical protein
LKTFALLLVVCALAACSKSPDSGTSADAAKDPFVQKLQSMPESDRAEYIRTHREEALASAGVKPPSNP